MFHTQNAHDIAAAFSPDSSLLATGGGDGSLLVWDLRTRGLVARFAPGQSVRGVSWLDARHVVTSSGDGSANGTAIFALDTGRRALGLPYAITRVVTAVPGAGVLAEVEGVQSKILEDNIKISWERGEAPRRDPNRCDAGRFQSSSGGMAYCERLLLRRADTMAVVADLEADLPPELHVPDEPVVSGNGRLLIGTPGGNGIVLLWELDERGQVVRARRIDTGLAGGLFNDDPRGPLRLLPSFEGDRVWVTQTDGDGKPVSQKRIDVSTGAVTSEPGAPVVAIARGATLVARQRGTAIVVEQKDGKELWQRPLDTRAEERFLGFSPDARWTVFAVNTGTVELAAARTGRSWGALGARPRQPKRVAFGPEGKLHVSSFALGQSPFAPYIPWGSRLSAWSLAQGELLGADTRKDVPRLEALVDRASGQRKVVLLGNIERDSCPGRLALPITDWSGPSAAQASARPVCFDPDPHQPGANTGDGTLHESGQMVLTGPRMAVLRLDSGRVTRLERTENCSDAVFSGDGTKLLARCRLSDKDRHNAFRLWDTTTGALLRDGAGPLATDLALDWDGSRIAYQTTEGVVGVYDFAKGAEILHAKLMARAIEFGASDDVLLVRPMSGELIAVDLSQARPPEGLGERGNWEIPLKVEFYGGREIVLDPTRSIAVVVDEDGPLEIRDARTGALRASLLEYEDGEWAAISPGGAYAGSWEVGERLGFVFPGNLENYRFEQFAATHHRPELLRRRLAGERADVDAKLARPPTLEITRSAALGSRARLDVRYASPGRVDVLRVFAEGVASETAAVCRPEGSISLELPLPFTGNNRVSVTAFDASGRSSLPAVSDLRNDAAGERPDIWVVAVGVSRYPHLPERMQLGFADDDARALADKLAGMAGPRGFYAAAHVDLLTDAQATPEATARALAGLSRMRPSDVAVVFFAGHGFKAGAGNDMVFATSAVHVIERDGRREVAKDGTVAWSDLAKALERARGRVLVAIDACHSGHVTRELTVPNDSHAAALSARGSAGVIVFAAAKGRQLSYEPSNSRGLELTGDRPLGGLESQHGFFTAALLSALDAPDTDRDSSGTVEVSELLERVTARVQRATRGAQSPWVARRDVFGDFALARPTGLP